MDLLSALLNQMNICLEYYHLAQIMVEFHISRYSTSLTFLNIFHFYTEDYLWKNTSDGKLINKAYEHNWIYGDEKFLFTPTDKLYDDKKCSAFQGIFFLAYTHD